jgi:hypothetical protein
MSVLTNYLHLANSLGEKLRGVARFIALNTRNKKLGGTFLGGEK